MRQTGKPFLAMCLCISVRVGFASEQYTRWTPDGLHGVTMKMITVTRLREESPSPISSGTDIPYPMPLIRAPHLSLSQSPNLTSLSHGKPTLSTRTRRNQVLLGHLQKPAVLYQHEISPETPRAKDPRIRTNPLPFDARRCHHRIKERDRALQP